MKKTCWCNLRG